MAGRKINTWLKLGLELGPVIAFFVAFVRLKDQTVTIGGTDYGGFILATMGFVPLMLLSTAILWRLTGRIAPMQIATLVLVVVFGGLSVWFNDERFFKMKTSIVYGVFAGILGVGLLQGRSYLAYVMAEMLPMQEAGWMILTRRLCLGFVVLAGANEVVWRTMSDDTWVKIETFGFPIALFAFLWWQVVQLQHYMIDPPGKDG